ncbi:flagellar basal body-associated FliL family protein [Phenylobacterium sp.]|uniref:flagellar basal body-associated FliL family protein n=1 Tax=Phenylobacterium sp. TaxID=1871053 RepID=UPI0035B02C27
MAKDKVKEAPEDGAEDGDGEDASAKKKLPLKMLIIAGAAAVLVLGGGGTAAFIFLKPKPAATGEAGADHGKKAEKKKEKKGGHGGGKEEAKTIGVVAEGPNGVTYYTLPDIVVNMQTPDGKATFLKLKLTFELPDEDMVDQLEENNPRLQDMFQTFLRELRPDDLAGSQGSYQLRMEILRRVNLLLAPAKINAVLIEEMLIN